MHHVRVVMFDLGAVQGPSRVRRSLSRPDQTQEETLCRLLLSRIEAVLERRICRLTDGAGHTAGRAESIQRQGVSLSAYPSLDEGVCEQRQRARFVTCFGEDGVHQVSLQIQAGASCG